MLFDPCRVPRVIEVCDVPIDQAAIYEQVVLVDFVRPLAPRRTLSAIEYPLKVVLMMPHISSFESEATRPPEERPLVHPLVDRPFIGALVREFYDRVRKDPRLGPIFASVIREDWEPHLEKMTDFWCAVVLKNGAYSGRPVPAHLRLKQVREDDFTIWLGLFRETAASRCPPEVAVVFIDRAERIARSLSLAMFFRLDRPVAGAPA